jgi:hypothetical protein
MAIYRNWGDSISLNMFELGKKHLVIIHWHFLGRSTVVPEKQSKALTASVDSWRKRPRSHWPGDNVKTWYAPWSKHGILMVYETWADGHWYIDIYIYWYMIWTVLMVTHFCISGLGQNMVCWWSSHPKPSWNNGWPSIPVDWHDDHPAIGGEFDGPCCRPDMGEESEKL